MENFLKIVERAGLFNRDLRVVMKMTPRLEYDLVGESLILQKVILVPEI